MEGQGEDTALSLACPSVEERKGPSTSESASHAFGHRILLHQAGSHQRHFQFTQGSCLYWNLTGRGQGAGGVQAVTGAWGAALSTRSFLCCVTCSSQAAGGTDLWARGLGVPSPPSRQALGVKQKAPRTPGADITRQMCAAMGTCSRQNDLPSLVTQSLGPESTAVTGPGELRRGRGRAVGTQHHTGLLSRPELAWREREELGHRAQAPAGQERQ